MQRRTVAVIAATVTAAGAAVAFTLPSMADTTPSPQAARATDGVAPQLLAAMRRDLGVTTDQATAAVKRAEWASGVSATLRSEIGSAWAGSWLTDKGTTLNIGVTDAAMAAKVLAAGAVPKIVHRHPVEAHHALKHGADARRPVIGQRTQILQIEGELLVLGPDSPAIRRLRACGQVLDQLALVRDGFAARLRRR